MLSCAAFVLPDTPLGCIVGILDLFLVSFFFRTTMITPHTQIPTMLNPAATAPITAGCTSLTSIGVGSIGVGSIGVGSSKSKNSMQQCVNIKKIIINNVAWLAKNMYGGLLLGNIDFSYVIFHGKTYSQYIVYP